MEYKFTRQLDGTINFTYKNKDGEDKKITFQKDVEMVNKLASVNVIASMSLIKELAKDGLTINDLKVEKNVNGKKIIDESNYLSLKDMYLKKAQYEVIMEIIEHTFGMSLINLLKEIGVDLVNDSTEQNAEVEKFTTDLMLELMGVDKSKIPSSEKNTK